MATAAALAFVDIDVTCMLQGNALIMLDASTFVSARAEAYAEAVSGILESANVCPNCTVVTEAISRTSRSIFAEAVASADIQVISSHLVLPVVHC